MMRIHPPILPAPASRCDRRPAEQFLGGRGARNIRQPWTTCVKLKPQHRPNPNPKSKIRNMQRVLEPEVMDSLDEAIDYDAMDHAEVNRLFVADFLQAAGRMAADAEILDLGTGTAQIPIEMCRTA